MTILCWGVFVVAIIALVGLTARWLIRDYFREKREYLEKMSSLEEGFPELPDSQYRGKMHKN